MARIANLSYPERANLTGFRRLLVQAGYTLISLLALLVSYCLLMYSYMSFSNSFLSTSLMIIEGAAILVSLYYSVANIRSLLHGEIGGFSFGLWNELNKLTRTERLTLVRMADRAYSEKSYQSEASLAHNLKQIFSIKGLVLLIVGALIGFSVSHSSNWLVLPWVLLAVMAPYFFLIFYQFFCSYADKNKFRSEFVRAYLDNGTLRDSILDELKKTNDSTGFLLPMRNFWSSFCLRFPFVTGFALQILGRTQFLFWGYIISTAILPFIGIKLAATSFLEPFAQFFAFAGWKWGFDQSINLMAFFATWNIPHTFGAIITLAAISYLLGIISLPSQIKIFGPRSLLSIGLTTISSPVAFLYVFVYPFIWLLSFSLLKDKHLNEIINDNLSRFWGTLFHLWIIIAEIQVLLIVGIQLIKIVK
jgi:hypothetical protein